MEQFASLNEENIKVVGVGILDSRELADDFQATTGLDKAQLVWSDDREIWSTYGVQAQHTTILFDSSGNEAQRWTNFSAADIAAAVG